MGDAGSHATERRELFRLRGQLIVLSSLAFDETDLVDSEENFEFLLSLLLNLAAIQIKNNRWFMFTIQ
ncbi:MAG: hypothetical protein WBV95_21170 [Desulfobacterales bacterium]